MPQYVKGDAFQLGTLGGCGHRSCLFARLPRRAVRVREHQILPTRAMLAEELCGLWGQRKMACLAGLGLGNGEGACIAVEVMHLYASELGKAAASFESCTYQWTELGIASVDEPRRLRDLKVANSRDLYISVWLESPSPCAVLRDMAFVIGVIQRGFQLCQNAIGAGTTTANIFVVFGFRLELCLACLRSGLLRKSGQGGEPRS